MQAMNLVEAGGAPRRASPFSLSWQVSVYGEAIVRLRNKTRPPAQWGHACRRAK